MGIQKFTFVMIFLLVGNITFLSAQTQDVAKKKVVIISKKKDADGKEVVTKIVKEGDEVSEEEMEKMLTETLAEEGLELKGSVDKEIIEEITVDENGKKTTTKRIKMKINSEDVEVEKERKMEDKVMIIENSKSDKKMVKQQEMEIIVEGNEDETIDLGNGMELKIKGAKDGKANKKNIKIIISEENW